jgi:hypothetical protein
VVLPHAHALGLRALGGHLLDELHLVALLELIETDVHQIVETEIEFAAVDAPDEAVGFLGNQARHQARKLLRVGLGFAAQAPAVILELAFGRIEGIAQRDIYVFVPVAVHHDFASRHPDVDAHVEGLALILVLVRHFNHHPAGHDRFEKGFEFPGLFADVCLDCVGMLNVAKRDLQGCLHLVILG